MDGKGKNIDKTFLGREGGGGAGGVRYMDPAVTGKFFYSHILKHILRKSAVVLSLDNKLKRFIPKCMSLKRKAVYTVQSKSNSRAKSGIRSCCAARTWRPPQEAKVPYFADPLCFTRKNFETKEVKNLHRKKLENYRKPQEGA